MLKTSTLIQRLFTKNAVLTCLMVLVVFGSTSWADSLQTLRASGALGESYTGYVVAREASAQAEADSTNQKRKAVYAEKAAAQGVGIDQVGKVYAQEIFKKLPKGTWIQNASGQWTQK